MDFLQQVAALLGVGFVGPCEPGRPRAVAGRGLPVEFVWVGLSRRPDLHSFHTQGSRRPADFLTAPRLVHWFRFDGSVRSTVNAGSAWALKAAAESASADCGLSVSGPSSGARSP